MKSALVFLMQSIVVGFAVAFLVVLVRPDLLPTNTAVQPAPPSSYADAVDISAPAVANVYTKRLVRDDSSPGARTRFRVSTNFASAVIIDADGFLVTNYHVVAEAAEIRIQFSDGLSILVENREAIPLAGEFIAAFQTDDAVIGIESFLEHGPGKASFTGQ